MVEIVPEVRLSGGTPHGHDFLGANHGRNERRVWAVITLTVTMMVVEIGSSTATLARPNAPPNAPEAPTMTLWSQSDSLAGCFAPRVATATSNDLNKARRTDLLRLTFQSAGSIFIPFSMGLPRMLVRRAVKPGFSSKPLAKRSSANSSLDSGVYGTGLTLSSMTVMFATIHGCGKRHQENCKFTSSHSRAVPFNENEIAAAGFAQVHEWVALRLFSQKTYRPVNFLAPSP